MLSGHLDGVNLGSSLELLFSILRLTSPVTFSLCLKICYSVVRFGATVLSFDCCLSLLAFDCPSYSTAFWII